MKVFSRPPKLVASKEAPRPLAVYDALKECAGNLSAAAVKLGSSRDLVEQVVKRWGYDKLIENEFLDELEAKVLQASLGYYPDPKFNPVTAISVLAKRRPEKWSGRKATVAESKLLPPVRKPDSSKHTPSWKKRADALRIKYAAVEPTIREPYEPASGADDPVLPENPRREIVEPDVKRGIREPD